MWGQPAPAVLSSEARLARLRQTPLLAHHLDSLDHELQPFPAEFGPRDHLLDVLKHVRVTSLLAQFFEKGMNLREQDEHFPAHRRLNEQLLVERPLQYEGRRHAPV